MTREEHMANLHRLFDKASPQEVQEAAASYHRYNRLLGLMGARHGASIETACGVFSALSPNNDYLGNLRDAAIVLRAALEGIPPERYSVATYGQNKRKAHAIATGTPPLELIKARKTLAFYLNCLHPERGEHVTVDGHMYWVWMGRRGSVTARRIKGPDTLPVANVSARLYQDIAEGIRELARAKGVLPLQAQAVLWAQYRKAHGIQWSQQGELLASDEIIAGLDYEPRPPQYDWRRPKAPAAIDTGAPGLLGGGEQTRNPQPCKPNTWSFPQSTTRRIIPA